MILPFRSLFAFLLFAALILPLTETISLARVLVLVEVAQPFQDDDDDFGMDEDMDDFEEDDDQEFKNNPWQVDERKLFAAKKFVLKNQFAMKIKQIENICGELDKKQKLKLAIASKGATEKALEKFTKSWKDQMKQFGNQFQMDDEDEDDGGQKKKNKKKRKPKRFVVNKVDEIDAQTMQMLENSFFGGTKKEDFTDIPLWNRTVDKVLNEDQQEKLNAHIEELKIAKRKARAETFLADMRLKLALSDQQIGQFDKLVRPAFLEKDIETSSNYDAMATLYLGSKHDKKKMKELLSDEQYLLLEITVKPAEGYASWFDDDDAVADDPVAAVVQGMEFGLLGAFVGGIFEAAGDFADFLADPFEGMFNW